MMERGAERELGHSHPVPVRVRPKHRYNPFIRPSVQKVDPPAAAEQLAKRTNVDRTTHCPQKTEKVGTKATKQSKCPSVMVAPVNRRSTRLVHTTLRTVFPLEVGLLTTNIPRRPTRFMSTLSSDCLRP